MEKDSFINYDEYIHHMMLNFNNNNLKIGMIFLNNLNENLYSRYIERLSGIDIKIVHNELKELVNKNILDYRTEGRMKFYFLKNTFESKCFLEMVEIFKKNLFLLNNKLLSLKLIKLADITEYMIFGSYSRGNFDEDSDLDLIIFSKKNKNIQIILKKLDMKVQIHYIDFEEFINLVLTNQALSIEIIKNHISFTNNQNLINLILKWKKIK